MYRHKNKRLDSFFFEKRNKKEMRTKSNQSLLIKNGYILTMRDDFKEYKYGYIYVENGIIEEIGIGNQYPSADIIIDAEKNIVCPGFVNTHTHLGSTLMRGVGSDKTLFEWLNRYIWPIEAQMTQEDCYFGAKLSMIELIRTGTTTFSDMYFYEEATVQATIETGLRAVIGYGMIDIEGEEKRKQELTITKNLIEKYKNCSELISFTVAPHAPYTCSEELLIEAHKLAVQYKIPYHIHVAETLFEIKKMKKERGITPVAYLDKLEVLDSNTIAVHMVHVLDSELELIRDNNVKIAHCPRSNLKLGSGFAPIPKYDKNSIVVGLGTDGASSNNNLSMIKELQTLAIIHKGNAKDATVLPAKKVIQMATINGAKVLHLEHKVGSLEVGKDADIIIIDTKGAHVQPPHDPYSMLAYAINCSDVRDTIVKGKILMKNHVLQTIDERDVIKQAKNTIKRIKKENTEFRSRL